MSNHTVGTLILGWKIYTEGKPREITAVRDTGYSWQYLGESEVRESEQSIDPFFQLPGWGCIPNNPDQSTEEKLLSVADAQSREIIRLKEENDKLKLRLQQAGVVM